MSIRIGTASRMDKVPGAAEQRFYPAHLDTAAARLHHYAGRFPLLEWEQSFHAIPDTRMALGWLDGLPGTFRLQVRAFRLFTGHQTSPAALPEDLRLALPASLQRKSVLYYGELPAELQEALWQRFVAALAPLRQAGCLGLVHFQFPPWLLRNRAGHAHVEHCAERLSGHPLSVEFRNASWLEAGHVRETQAFEQRLGLVHTVVDEPQGLSSSIPALWDSSDPARVLVRLHGRKAGPASTRPGGSYEEADLEDLGLRLLRLAEPGRQVDVVVAGEDEGGSLQDAEALMRIVASLGGDVLWPRGEAPAPTAPHAEAEQVGALPLFARGAWAGGLASRL